MRHEVAAIEQLFLCYELISAKYWRMEWGIGNDPKVLSA